MSFFCRSFSSKGRIIHVLTNPIRSILGTVSNDLNGDSYYRFQGIPYAQPPLGNLRFKAPLRIEPWSGILDATKEGNCCYSRHPLKTDKVEGSEDCLYLNVYTKNLNNKDLKPVMFWIHGGAFAFGNGGTEFYGPDYLITEDVVIVTLNYRLGILGFLSIDDPSLEVPGNAGLKDIVLALKWVQENIADFGGDPQNVTIFGQSAGGLAVHLLMLSKRTKGLFHKAIAQSGSALHPWAKTNENVCRHIDPQRSEKEVYKKLMAMPVHEFLKIQKKIEIILEYVGSVPRLLGYTVEEPNEEALITEDVNRIISTGDFQQVPLLIGHTSLEYIPIVNLRKIAWPGSGTCEDVIPYKLGYKIGSKESCSIGKELKRFYFGSDFGENNQQRLMMENDVGFLYGTILAAMKHAEISKTPVYFYNMSIETKLNFMKKYFNNKDPGACHSDDLDYLFKAVHSPNFEPGSIEDIAVRRFVRLWTNFAKYGNPTPVADDPLLPIAWKQATTEEMYCLNFGKDLEVSSDSEYVRRVRFLRKLFNE